MSRSTPASVRRHGYNSDSGFALVSVLWTLTILSLLAALMLSSSRSASTIERSLWQREEIDAAFDIAIGRAVLGILDARPDQRWPIDGRPVEFKFGDFTMQISVQDEFGKIDINTAPIELLNRLLQSAGLPAGQAQNMAADIVDWRENDELRRLRNAGFDNTMGAGASKSSQYQPRHAPFQSVAELRLVPGITPALFAKIEPAMTVYSHRSGFDSTTAPLAALLALPGMDAGKVQAMIRARPSGTAATPEQPALPPSSMAGRAFTVAARIAYRARIVTRKAMIRLTANPERTFWLLYCE